MMMDAKPDKRPDDVPALDSSLAAPTFEFVGDLADVTKGSKKRPGAPGGCTNCACGSCFCNCCSACVGSCASCACTG